MDDSSDKSAEKRDVSTSTSVLKLEKSPRKCNLSFSFNLDLDYMNSDHSSDSETADLQIDVSEVDNNEPPTKRKRKFIKETSVLNEMEEEIERQLDAKAAKTNLTARNVKNILKHVITNEHVRAMVCKRLHGMEEDVIFEPKLTRAKAKELAAAKVNIPWHITPVKKPSSQVLIEEEFPEDSSDEEYNPEQDKQSDDERETENSTNSDIDSQPPTPVNNIDPSLQELSKSQDIKYDSEGIFKIPCVPYIPTEEESIGQRTRSKYSLSETPLEQIEQAFIPPDITTDMYDSDCEIDEDWGNFLKEFTQPLRQEHGVEDDPEADPEYNILEDEETDLLDKEELRVDRGVKVTRKELNDLIAELFEFTDIFSKQVEQEVSKKKKTVDNLTPPIHNNTMSYSMINLLPTVSELEPSKLISFEQRHLLATQFRQYVQLTAQHFVMTYMHPQLHSQSKTCKENLNNIRYLSNGPNSAFNIENLSDALKLVSDWENKFLDPKFSEEYINIMEDETRSRKMYHANKWKYIPKFHPELEKLFMESKALMYPQLLPEIPFRSELSKCIKMPYLKSEESLIALGLEQFSPFVALKKTKFKSKKFQLIDTVQLISKYLLPVREAQGIFGHIQKRRISKEQNPIKHYFEKGTAPKTIHYITLEYDLKAPIQQTTELLPPRWQNYLSRMGQKIELLKQKHALNLCSDAFRKSNPYSTASNRHPLRNPVVNMLPKILPKILPISPKGSSNSATTNSIANEKSNDKSNHSSLGREQSGNSDFLNIEPKSTKVDRSANETLLQLPQLRKTTPRLAKTKSAQNMKLMAQGSGSKGISNSNAAKSKGKIGAEKNSSSSPTSSKVDDEDEIAELMLASTTIKKDYISRKKAKQARELENIKRLLEAENPLNEGEREAKFAASYLQKLHLSLEPTNPEIFKAVIKLFLDYNDKLDNINQLEQEFSFSGDSKLPLRQELIEKNMITKDSLAINLYRNINKKLQDFPELCLDFLLFLKPHQAAQIGKSVEYMMLQKMNEFLNVAQIYFTKQPSRLAKIMQAITQLSSDAHITLEKVQSAMFPILKGHPLVMDLFLQILPTGKIPECLFSDDLFENLTCPLGPHDKNKVYASDAPELYENIELPTSASQDDPYGGDNCKCNCHNVESLKNTNEHCMSCGTRFLNGRIYLQTSEGLRPAKITFPGADQEKLENIARVSLKVIDKCSLSVSSRQRRKSSKSETTDESCQKTCTLKSSPIKDNEDNERNLIKTKKGAKSPPKSTEQKRFLKKMSYTDDNTVIVNKKIRSPPCVSKRERKIERKSRTEQNDIYLSESGKLDEGILDENDHTSRSTTQDDGEFIKKTETGTKFSTEVDQHTTTVNRSIENMDILSSHECNTNRKLENINSKPWTRREDMILLQSIKEEYSERSFFMISQKLGDRTVSQVKERSEVLLSLLEKMA